MAAPIAPAVEAECYVYYDDSDGYYHYTSQKREGYSKQHNPIGEQYSKYDFSGFDN